MTHNAGASLEVRRPEPSVDLATLVECLADAVPLPKHRHAVKPHQHWPLLSWNPSEVGGALAIDTRAVISRLTTSSTAFQRLKLGPEAGFLRDAPVPRRRAEAHMGGRIVEGSGSQLRKALARLITSVDAELDETGITGANLEALAAAAPAQILREIADNLGCDVDEFLAGQTRLHRTTLETIGATQISRKEEIARTLTAVEEIAGDRLDLFEQMASATGELLRDQDLEPREIATAIAHYRQQLDTPGSQVARFFDFLETEALARVRLHIGFRLMDAIAEAAAERLDSSSRAAMQTLIAYVRRASGLFQTLGSPDGEDILLNLAREYGDQADFSLHDEVITVGFSACLPVWPEWVAQIFEEHRRASDQPALHATVREVSYRFRINGVNPDDRLSAYQSRLARIRQCLLVDDEPTRVRRHLAELVFLTATMSSGKRDHLSAEEARADAMAHARTLAAQLERGGREAIANTLRELEQQAGRVDTVTRALVAVLRASGPVVTRGIEGHNWDYFVNVLRGLVDLQRIGHALDRPFATDETPARESIAFYRNILITPDRSLTRSLFSMRVRVRLGERSLLSTGETVTGQIARSVPDRLLQVIWRPFETRVGPEQATRSPIGSDPVAWQAANRIELHYETRVLGKTHRSLDDQGEQLLAAFRTAFAVLAYVTLSRVLVRVREEAGLKERGDLAVSMLRLHAGPADNDPLGGAAALFAAAQAVEGALARDCDLRMQGLVLDEELADDKRRGAFGALFAGFPLVVERRIVRSSDYRIEPIIGLVTFGSRPCTSMPDQPDQAGDNLFSVRTYRAQSSQHQFGDAQEPSRAYRMWCDTARTEIRQATADESIPPIVTEEIRRLYELGCRHILLLAHRYGGRRIGGPVRYRLHDQANTLAAIAAQMPDLYVYPLIRDTFPATRMRARRSSSEDAFEILAPDEHLAGLADSGELRRGYTPVYSLATLHVIGEIRKPQSGVCTYFLLSDQSGGSIERTERIRSNLLLMEGEGRIRGLRGDLIAILRGLHYLEAERAPSRDHFFQPVLDPYRWLAPASRGNVGEVLVRTSRRRAGSVRAKPVGSPRARLASDARRRAFPPEPAAITGFMLDDDARQIVLWGDLFEVAVKRGCLGYLLHRGLLPDTSTTSQAWHDLTVGDLRQHLAVQSGVVDPAYRERQASSLEHMLLVGWGLGWTALREYLRRLGVDGPDIRAVFCPLSLPDRRHEPVALDRDDRLEVLWNELQLTGSPDRTWTGTGQPANADFLLLARTPERHHLLCLEFSLYAQLGDADFEAESAHLDELTRFVQRVDSRGVFTRLTAEVTGERFLLSERLVSHLPALTTRDKPLYKLCQGSSYATRLIELLERRGEGLTPVSAQVIAVTSAGLEGLSARFDRQLDDPRVHLMNALGAAYRLSDGEWSDDASKLTREIAAVQSQVARSLPPVLRVAFDESLQASPSDRSLDVRRQERVLEYTNPADEAPRGTLLRWLEDTPPEVDDLLGGDGRSAVVNELERQEADRPTITLRDLHSAAMKAGLRAAPPGQVTVLAAEGHPGVGKTTAVFDYLASGGAGHGYLCLYASPRIVINSEVTRKVARTPEDKLTGVLTLTTNARLMRAAPAWPCTRECPVRAATDSRRCGGGC